MKLISILMGALYSASVGSAITQADLPNAGFLTPSSFINFLPDSVGRFEFSEDLQKTWSSKEPINFLGTVILERNAAITELFWLRARHLNMLCTFGVRDLSEEEILPKELKDKYDDQFPLPMFPDMYSQTLKGLRGNCDGIPNMQVEFQASGKDTTATRREYLAHLTRNRDLLLYFLSGNTNNADDILHRFIPLAEFYETNPQRLRFLNTRAGSMQLPRALPLLNRMKQKRYRVDPIYQKLREELESGPMSSALSK